jgi:hypothetical protein
MLENVCLVYACLLLVIKLVNYIKVILLEPLDIQDGNCKIGLELAHSQLLVSVPKNHLIPFNELKFFVFSFKDGIVHNI